MEGSGPVPSARGMRAGRFRLRPAGDRSIEVRGWLGDGDVVYGGTSGEWDLVARPRLRPLTQWRAHTARTISMPIILTESVPAMVSRLDRFASGTRRADPKPLVLTSPGVRYTSGRRFALVGVTWGAATINEQGRLVRQLGTLELAEYVEHEYQRRYARSYRTITSRQGDTLSRIAARTLGKATRWRELRKHNPRHRDPRRRLPVGTKIRIPT